MTILYSTLAILYLLALAWAFTGIAWCTRVQRKFKALFDICDACHKTHDFAIWQRALDVIGVHLHTIKEYEQRNPLYWKRHWHDDWTKEVGTGDKQPTRLPN